MRDIPFRGRTESGTWIEGQLLYECHDNEPVIVNGGIEWVDGWEWNCMDFNFVDPETVGQFTGLYDANGVKIFEGDIIQYGPRRLAVWFNEEAMQWQAKQCRGFDVITFQDGMTEWNNLDMGWIAAERVLTGSVTTEVIGNVHDNPELLS